MYASSNAAPWAAFRRSYTFWSLALSFSGGAGTLASYSAAFNFEAARVCFATTLLANSLTADDWLRCRASWLLSISKRLLEATIGMAVAAASGAVAVPACGIAVILPSGGAGVPCWAVAPIAMVL